MSHTFRLLLILFLIPSCASVKQHDSVKQVSLLFEEARLIDVPLPLHLESVTMLGSCSHSHNEMFLTFTTPLSLEECRTLYRIESERLGWKYEAGVSLDSVCMLVYEKPCRVMVIILRPGSQTQTSIELAIGAKNSFSFSVNSVLK